MDVGVETMDGGYEKKTERERKGKVKGFSQNRREKIPHWGGRELSDLFSPPSPQLLQ